MIKIIAILVFPALIFTILGTPHAAVLSVFCSTVLLWLTEALPLPVTGLLVPVLLSCSGAVSGKDAFAPFGSDILYLFVGCFLLGRAIEKHGFDKRMAYFLLGRCLVGESLTAIHLVIALASFVLSMWISNTSAAIILTTVTLGILTSLSEHLPSDEIKRRLEIRLLLTCAFAASIGGLATPIGSPPNLIAIRFLSTRGVNISFSGWLPFALPISLAMLAVLFLILELRYPLRGQSVPGAKAIFRKLARELGPMHTGERQVALVFGLAVLLWILPSSLAAFFPAVDVIQAFNARLSMATVGLLAGISLFVLPVAGVSGLKRNLSWDDGAKIDWGTLMLFGGGLALGDALESSGAAKMLGTLLFQGAIATPILLICVVVFGSIVLSEFASNTAAASIMIPLILGLVDPTTFSQEAATAIVLASAFAASFGFMLPVSTPPNAIVYATGRVPSGEMLRTGVLFDVCGGLLIIVYFLFMR